MQCSCVAQDLSIKSVCVRAIRIDNLFSGSQCSLRQRLEYIIPLSPQYRYSWSRQSVTKPVIEAVAIQEHRDCYTSIWLTVPVTAK